MLTPWAFFLLLFIDLSAVLLLVLMLLNRKQKRKKRKENVANPKLELSELLSQHWYKIDYSADKRKWWWSPLSALLTYCFSISDMRTPKSGLNAHMCISLRVLDWYILWVYAFFQDYVNFIFGDELISQIQEYTWTRSKVGRRKN